MKVSGDVERLLADAIRLREAGEHETARMMLLALAATHPDDAQVQYQTAWVHDNLGLEREAVPFYERALALGLAREDHCGALLGLGSTFRTLGEYTRAEETLRGGMREFPDDRAFPVFLAMTLHNQGRHTSAMELLLRALAETSDDARIQRYRRAILFYADKLDQVWS